MLEPTRRPQHLLHLSRVVWCEVSSIAVVLTGDVSWWLAAFILLLIPVVGLARENRPWLRPLRALSSILAIVYLLFFPLDWLVLSEHLIFAVVHLIFYLKMHSLLHVQSQKERYRLYVLCLFEMLAAASMTVSVSFLFPLVGFVMVGSVVLTLEQVLMGSGTPAGTFPLRAVLRSGLVLGAVLLAVSLALFVALPRTSYAGFHISGVSGITSTGLGRDIRLGDFGGIKLDRGVVMRLVGERDELVTPPRWRGAAYDRYEEGRWKQTLSGMVLLPRRIPGEFLLDRPSLARSVTNQVFLEPLDTDVVFIPPASLQLSVSLPSVFVDPYLTVRTGRTARAGRRYRVSWRPGAPDSSSSLGGIERMEVWTRRIYLQMPELSQEFYRLARRITRGGGPPLDVAAAVESFLRRNYRYSLTTPARVRPDPLEDFLFAARAGHCEYFATAMVMIVRWRGLPSRLVTGFQRGERNEYADFEVIRKSNAHAWVEVFDDQRGWVAFDPTPSSPVAARSRTFEILFKRIDSLRLLWDMYVVAFDHERQRDVLGRLTAGMRATGSGLVRFAVRWSKLLAGLGLMVLAGLGLSATRWARRWWLKLRLPRPFRREGLRRARPEAAARFYEHLLRRLERLGFVKPAGVTPAEFAASLEGRLPGLTELTVLYYRVRFGDLELTRDQQSRAERLSTAVQVVALSMADLTGGAPEGAGAR